MTKFTAFFAAGLLLLTSACGSSAEDANAATAETPSSNSAPDTTPQETATMASNMATQDMTLGDENAPLSMIEYASVTCPGCAYFHQDIYPKLKSDYIETGKVRFTFREFPTAPQQLSYLGFVLSRCSADSTGAPAYFAMLNTLFENQRTWVGENWQTEILKYAAQAGMSEDDFKTCIERQDILDTINANVKGGIEEYDVSSTPTFIIGEEKMGRYKDAEEFFSMLDEALTLASAE